MQPAVSKFYLIYFSLFVRGSNKYQKKWILWRSVDGFRLYGVKKKTYLENKLEFKKKKKTAFPQTQLLFQVQNKRLCVRKQVIWMEVTCAGGLWACRRDVLRRTTEICVQRDSLLCSPWAFNWLLINVQLFFLSWSSYLCLCLFIEPSTPAVADIGAKFHLLIVFFFCISLI